MGATTERSDQVSDEKERQPEGYLKSPRTALTISLNGVRTHQMNMAMSETIDSTVYMVNSLGSTPV